MATYSRPPSGGRSGPLVVGVDVGTSGLRAIAVDVERGAVVASASRSYPLSTPRPGWAEQDPDDFVAAAKEALAEIAKALGRDARHVRAIGVTGQMHSSVLLDAEREVVRPAIIWCDVRTTDECAAIEAALGHDGLARNAGNRALPGFTLPKLLWVKKHEPAAWARVRTVLMPKDYVGLRLTGVLGADASDASGTLAFHPGERRWSTEILAAVGVAPELFPRCGESPEPLGALTAEMAEETGLTAGIPVVRGAADNAAGAVGLGVVRPGRVMASIGTSGVVLAHGDAWVVEPAMRLHAFCHAVPGAFYLMGVMLAAGGALRWYRDVLCDGEKLAAELQRVDPYVVITDAASTAKEGAGGVLFLPYLMGERTPHADANARGAFVGMSAATTKADLSRAVLEGISFGLCDSLELVEAALGGKPTEPIRLTGGGARSPFWRQLLADVFGAEVAITNSTEGPAYGAAILAATGAGFFASVEEGCDALVHVTSRVAPHPDRAARYRVLHAQYKALYRDLEGRFRALAAI